MVEVSKDKFFHVIGPMDVHPRSERMYSSWETPRREVIGKTTPGYMCQDDQGNRTTKTTFFLADHLA